MFVEERRNIWLPSSGLRDDALNMQSRNFLVVQWIKVMVRAGERAEELRRRVSIPGPGIVGGYVCDKKKKKKKSAKQFVA